MKRVRTSQPGGWAGAGVEHLAMVTLSNAAALKLIDELRDAWTSDPRRAAEIIGELENALHGHSPERGWAVARRERLQREHKEREQRELEKRERDERKSSGTAEADHEAGMADR